MQDRVMLRKRAVIESVKDELKNICQIEHTRHRSFTNFITNLVVGLLNSNLLELCRSKYSIVIGEESKVRFICRL